MNPSSIAKNEYLKKKYLSGVKKTKKKTHKNVKGTGMKIIDDDADLSKSQVLDNDELDLVGEDAPQIVAIIDERPQELKMQEQFSRDKWKTIAESDDLSIKNNEERYDSDQSIPRSKRKEDKSELSILRTIKKHEISANHAPQRRQLKSDKINKNKDRRPDSNNSGSDSDISVPRKKTFRHPSPDSDKSVTRKKKSHHSSPDSDISVTRKKKSRHRSRDSDISVTRKKKSHHSSPHSRYKRSHRMSPDSDQSVSRNNNRRDNVNKSRNSSESSDISVPRSKTKSVPRSVRKSSRWGNPDEELGERILSNIDGKKREEGKRRDDKKSKSSEMMEKTLDGKKAGLQNARQLREENQEFRKKEDNVFNNLPEEISGRHAKTIRRDLRGKRETEEDKQKKAEKEAREIVMEAKYKQWGKGLAQVQEQDANIRDYIHEASKPLARFRDDKDLENALREKERDGDPMLEYMRRKESAKGSEEKRPVYAGPYPPNRFNLRPGHRWDGVDRSNGHEAAVFQARSAQKATAADQYKWSTEDM